MKRLMFFLLSVSVLSVIVSFPFERAFAASSEFKPITIKFGTFVPGIGPESERVYAPLCREITKRTGGKLNITYHPDGVLASGKEGIDATISGHQQMTYFVPGYNSGRFPSVEVMELPGLFPNTVLGTTAAMAMLGRGWFDKDFKDVKVLALGTVGPYFIWSKSKINKLADFKNKRFKVSSRLASRSATALGAIGVLMPTPEVYMSIERGLLEGITFNYVFGLQYKMQEVTKYITEVNLGYVSAGIAINKDLWNSLPSDIQRIVESTTQEFLLGRWAGVLGDYDNSLSKQKAIKIGMKVTNPSQEETDIWISKTKPVYEQWMTDTKDYNPKGMLKDIFEIRKTMGLTPLSFENEIQK